ncbi:MAG: hypothetical protein L0229_17555 [Blastocatellia bacterium]|nr:hypothetical protein [Blastocatellia bacterium]
MRVNGKWLLCDDDHALDGRAQKRERHLPAFIHHSSITGNRALYLHLLSDYSNALPRGQLALFPRDDDLQPPICFQHDPPPVFVYGRMQYK